ncbi:hypothetical protein F383_19608 [Gossypium arboreum]|uniref:Uncharacterized protein n=1 Tax=Gossypium arboreum TaxID=29729 RepID=A0A0B0NRE6_GOSAR|nr:hypothetical protein F383_19608 [Gossypium arboreum]
MAIYKMNRYIIQALTLSNQ